MRLTSALVTATVALSGLLATATASATDIPVAHVSAASTFHTYDANNLINGAGLAGDLHDGNWFNKWITDRTVNGLLTFDLGSFRNIGSTTIWNYGPGCCGSGRSVKDLGIGYSADGIHYTHFADFALSMPQDETPFPGETLRLNFGARYVQFSLNSNYGDDYTGLSEVKFTAAVPEPETYAMLIAGLGLLACVNRRRLRK